jgi:hypothetical protein
MLIAKKLSTQTEVDSNVNVKFYGQIYISIQQQLLYVYMMLQLTDYRQRHRKSDRRRKRYLTLVNARVFLLGIQHLDDRREKKQFW